MSLLDAVCLICWIDSRQPSLDVHFCDFPVHKNFHVLVIDDVFSIVTGLILNEHALLTFIQVGPVWAIYRKSDLTTKLHFKIALLIRSLDLYRDLFLDNKILLPLFGFRLLQEVKSTWVNDLQFKLKATWKRL